MTDIQEQITILVALQGVDLEIIAAEQQILALNDEASSLGKAVADHEAQVVAEKERLDGLKKSYRELDLESKDNAAKIQKSDVKLRAVKTNKEYQSTLKEIKEIQKVNSALEDRMITLLDELESQEGAVQQRETQLARFVQACNDQKQKIADQIAEKERTVETLRAKKTEIRNRVNPATITIWDDVKTKVRGMAVVPVQQAVCMGCHMNIPPQLNNELRRYDELRFCPHCRRIIYWKEKDGD